MPSTLDLSSSLSLAYCVSSWHEVLTAGWDCSGKRVDGVSFEEEGGVSGNGPASGVSDVVPLWEVSGEAPKHTLFSASKSTVNVLELSGSFNLRQSSSGPNNLLKYRAF